MNGTLCGFGYRGLRGDDLRALLADIDVVCDVRYRPFSRWAPQWNGPEASRRTVEAAGARYVWLRGLGNVNYRGGPVAIANLEDIGVVVEALERGLSVGLLCACASPETCHRKVLAEEVQRRLLDVEYQELREVVRSQRRGQSGL